MKIVWLSAFAISLCFSRCDSTYAQKPMAKQPAESGGLQTVITPTPVIEKESGWQENHLNGNVKNVTAINYNIEERAGKIVPTKETGVRNCLKFNTGGALAESDGYCDGNIVKPCEMIRHTFDKNGFNIRMDGINVDNGEVFTYKYKNDIFGRPIETEYYKESTTPLRVTYTSYNLAGKKYKEISYTVDGGIKMFADSTQYIYSATGKLLEKATYVTEATISEMNRFQYNSNGNLAEQIIYTWKGKLNEMCSFDDFGYLTCEKMFDEKGNMIWQQKYQFDQDDMRLDASDNKWGKVISIDFDDKRNWTSKTYAKLTASETRDPITKKYTIFQKPYLIIKRNIEYWQ